MHALWSMNRLLTSRSCLLFFSYLFFRQYTESTQPLYKAIGRLFLNFPSGDILCTGTLVEGEFDRVVIATAAHCVYDTEFNTFASNIMFIPGQDDGGGDGSDRDCSNDPYGCFYPTFAVISLEYVNAADFDGGREFDYAFLVAADTETTNQQNQPLLGVGGGGGPGPTLLDPMPIAFPGISTGQLIYQFGYPVDQDPQLTYSSDFRQNAFGVTGVPGNYNPCSGLSAGASGGPWTVSDPSSGTITVNAVTSYSTSPNGAGTAPYTSKAGCVYAGANSLPLGSASTVVDCSNP